MAEAGVFMADVDQLSGLIDVTTLPEETGVYAIFDESSMLQYIGLSKNIRRSVENHAKSIGPREVSGLISQIRVCEMPGAQKMELKTTWEAWIKEHMDAGGEIPVGNLPEGAPGADPRWRSSGPQAKPALSLGGPAGIQTPAEALGAVKRAVESNPVIIFMKGTPAMPQCGFSARSVGILKEMGIPFEAVNVMDEQANGGVRDAVKQYSNWPTIPQLFAKGKLVGGADIMSQLFQTGELERVLKAATTGEEVSSGSSAAAAAAAAAAPAGRIDIIDDPRRPTATALCKALNSKFQLKGLRVRDDSADHEGDAGALEMGITGESHFTLEIVAADFEGLSPVERQQRVYDALSGVMPRIHALSLVTKAPAEVMA